jgi:hypothetical protein
MLLVVKPEGRRPFGRLRHGWEYNTTICEIYYNVILMCVWIITS